MEHSAGLIIKVVLLTSLAGGTIPLGGFLASREKIRPHWLERELRHGVIAFGGGILLAAVALVLVPEGMQDLSALWVTACMTAGGLCFFWIDYRLAKSQTAASQLVAMLSDFVPEAVVLGAGFSYHASTGALLAFLIAMQNLPEGFNAYREVMASGKLKKRTLLTVFLLMVPLGPVAGLSGLLWLGQWPQIVSGIMLFAAGGILYLMFQDIAPQAKLQKHWAPALGAVLGFLFGMVGDMVVGP